MVDGNAFIFGIFTIDVAHSANLVMKLKQYAKEHNVVVKYENIKAHIRAKQKWLPGKYHFFRPFHSSVPLIEQLSEMYGSNGKTKNVRKGLQFSRKN